MRLRGFALLVAVALQTIISSRINGQSDEELFESKVFSAKRESRPNANRRRSKNSNRLLGELDLLPNFQASSFNPPAVASRKTQCKKIPSQFVLCYGIGYEKMHLPNLQGHDSMDELMKQSNEWTPLLSTRCHPETRKFLCSVFAPVCVQGFDRPVPPCRSLCKAVRDGCSPTMARFAYSWPPMLNCSQFLSDDELCMRSETNTLPTTISSPGSCFPCRQKKTISRKKICAYDFVVKARVKRISYEEGNTRLFIGQKSRTVLKWLNNIRSEAATRKIPKKNVMWLKDGLNCTCDVLTRGNRADYLFGGWQESGRLNLDSITKWRKSDKRITKFLKRRCKARRVKNKRSGGQ